MARQHVEPMGRVRTKIVATLGPASSKPEIIQAMAEAGADVFRLNFSHGTHEEHTATLRAIRDLSRTTGRPVGVLQDLSGPKIRLGSILGNEVACNLGAEFRLVSDRDDNDDPHQLTCSYRDLPNDLKPGETVLFADGNVAMEVLDAADGQARLRVTLPGRLRSRQGVNLPGTNLKLDSLTEKDIHDLDWTTRHPVEYIAMSFVRTAADVSRLRQEMEARNLHANIIAKIEKPQAVANLDAILAVTDAVMVARGDLGVEMDVEQVPAIQKRIIKACHRARLPVITATQMLNSMEVSSRPTRAEASDVFNAVLDGTDAVMLSGETAIGQYPVEAVAMMSRIGAEAEKLLPLTWTDPGPPTRSGWINPITEAVVDAANLACERLGAALLVVATHSGQTALAVSKHRGKTRTLALADDFEQACRMALFWGVTPQHFPEISDISQALDFAVDWAYHRGLVAMDDRVVLLQGTLPGRPTHNALLVREIDSPPG